MEPQDVRFQEEYQNPADPCRTVERRLFPIVVIAFDRTDYLRQTLLSLKAQGGTCLIGREIHLVQDGAYNTFSGDYRCDPTIPPRNAELFRSLIPDGVVHMSPSNLGVAMNFDRAERLVFEDLGAEAGVFLEDDLVLGPYYLKTLETLIDWALLDERVGYVSAYGDHRVARDQQLANRSKLTLMGHNWAFGLTRRQWLKQAPYVGQYLAIVRDSDYRRRNHDAIVDLFHSWGLGVPGTSQDVAKTHAVILTNAAKVNTYACFGQYIGQIGFHFTPSQFASMKYSDTCVMNEDIFRLVVPPEAELRKLIHMSRASAMVETVARSTAAAISASKGAGALELLERVRAKHSSNQLAEASLLCEQGATDFPTFRDQYGHMVFMKESVRISLARGDLEEARRAAGILSDSLSSTDPCVHVLFHRHYSRIGDIDAARREAELCLQRDPENEEALAWLAARDTDATSG